MKLVTAPQFDLDVFCLKPEKNLFLAGSISSAADWQNILIDKGLANLYNVFNPRRKEFDVSDPKMEKEQITWEFQCINKLCKNILFWFSYETVAPITLYEYGRALAKFSEYKKFYVGIHPDYPRKNDVIIQTELALGYGVINFQYSLDDLYKTIYHDWYYKNYSR